jgi:hypothetical protein
VNPTGSFSVNIARRNLQVQYYLELGVIGPWPVIEISEEQYSSVQKSSKTLKAALELEKKYVMMIGAYETVERTAMEVLLSRMIRETWGYDQFLRDQLILNEKLMGFLSCARLYIDRGAVDAATCAATNCDIERKVKELRAKEYDSTAEYKFLEKLRNHAQHYGPPIHATSYGSRRTDHGAHGNLEYYLVLKATKNALEEDTSFPRGFLGELGEEIDLRMHIRVYVERLSHVHAETRRLTSSYVDNARQVLQEAMGMYAAIHTGSLLGLRAVCREGDVLVNHVPILLDWDDVRKKLQREYPELVNLRKRHISTNQTSNRKPPQLAERE